MNCLNQIFLFLAQVDPRQLVPQLLSSRQHRLSSRASGSGGAAQGSTCPPCRTAAGGTAPRREEEPWDALLARGPGRGPGVVSAGCLTRTECSRACMQRKRRCQEGGFQAHQLSELTPGPPPSPQSPPDSAELLILLFFTITYYKLTSATLFPN